MPFKRNGHFEKRRLNGKPAFPLSGTDCWSTPEEVYKALDEEFHFDFDPCPINGKAGDGLASLFSEWKGKRAWINCPYGRDIPKWMKRAQEADLAVFLIPSRTDTRWFFEIVLPYAKEIRFIRGRLRFGGAKAGAPFPSMLVVFAKEGL